MTDAQLAVKDRTVEEEQAFQKLEPYFLKENGPKEFWESPAEYRQRVKKWAEQRTNKHCAWLLICCWLAKAGFLEAAKKRASWEQTAPRRPLRFSRDSRL